MRKQALMTAVLGSVTTVASWRRWGSTCSSASSTRTFRSSFSPAPDSRRTVPGGRPKLYLTVSFPYMPWE